MNETLKPTSPQYEVLILVELVYFLSVEPIGLSIANWTENNFFPEYKSKCRGYISGMCDVARPLFSL